MASCGPRVLDSRFPDDTKSFGFKYADVEQAESVHSVRVGRTGRM